MKNIFENLRQKLESKKMEPEKIEPERTDDLEAEEEIKARIDSEEIVEKLKKLNDHDYNFNNLYESGAVSDLIRLVYELKERLENYNTIISDDASGRIPSLLFYNLINRQREKINKSKAKIYCIASGRGIAKEKKMAIFDFIKRRSLVMGKTLVVTEFIETGQSMDFLANLLKTLGIDFDIASVSVSDEINKKMNWSEEIKRRLYYGGNGSSGAWFHSRPSMSGVVKQKKDTSPHSKKMSKEYFKEYGNRISLTRDSIKILAEELSKLLN